MPESKRPTLVCYEKQWQLCGQKGVEVALNDRRRGTSGGRGHIVDALLKEYAPVVRHDSRANFLSLRFTQCPSRNAQQRSRTCKSTKAQTLCCSDFSSACALLIAPHVSGPQQLHAVRQSTQIFVDSWSCLARLPQASHNNPPQT